MLFRLLFILLIPGFSFSQTKFEREIRLKRHEVPDSAKEFIDVLPFKRKVKWYKEFGFEKTSIEAKTKFDRKRFSIEFSPKGELEDVEIKIKPNSIPFETRSKINAHLQSESGSYKIRKVQVQYSGEPKSVLSFLLHEHPVPEIVVRYELIVTARVNKLFKKFEYLFSAEGKFLHKIEVVQKNSDNIEF